MTAYTAGFMTRITCRLTAKNQDQLRNPTLGNLVWATFILLTARCYASAILAMALCLSVCPSQVGVLSKRLNESSWFLACELPSSRPTLC